MTGRYVLIPLKTFQDLCTSTKRNGNKITGVIQNWTHADSTEKTKRQKRYLILYNTNKCNIIFINFGISEHQTMFRSNRDTSGEPRKRQPKRSRAALESSSDSYESEST